MGSTSGFIFRHALDAFSACLKRDGNLYDKMFIGSSGMSCSISFITCQVRLCVAITETKMLKSKYH